MFGWRYTGLTLFRRKITGLIVPHPIDAGDAAPAFRLPVSPEKTVTLADFAGRQLVLFFYPKDSTTACTREAQDFTAMLPKFSRRKIALLGVSRDSIQSHQKFVAKYGLKVSLGADEDGRACESYGVWQEKQLYGRKFMGIVRTTFLIGADGVVRQVWRKVRVPGHAEAVFDAATS